MSTEQATERVLRLTRSETGDRSVTFEEFVSTRGPVLVRFARLIAGDRHRGEDLAQEVFAKAYARWRRISAMDRPEVYLRRMLVNQNASWWRRRTNREVATDVSAAGPSGNHGKPGGHGDPVSHGDHGVAVAERDEVWRLLGTLPARQRAALVLRYYEDLDDTHIAEILGCSPVTVRTHVMRGLQSLRNRVPAASQAATSTRSER